MAMPSPHNTPDLAIVEPTAQIAAEAAAGNHIGWLDDLRVTAACATVVLHVASPVVAATPDPQSPDWWAGNIAVALVRWCEPIFVMISGYLLGSTWRAAGIIGGALGVTRLLVAVPLLRRVVL